MHRRYSHWELLFYLSLLVLLVWLIFKVTGVINTPALLEYGVPIFSAMFALFTLYRDLMERMNRMGNGLVRVAVKMENVENRVARVEDIVQHGKR